MSALHPKIESFLIHAIAALFLFSTIAASFLGYSVYQANKTPNLDSNIATPVRAAQEPILHFWDQTFWTGGVSSSNFTIPWDTSGGWDKYISASNVIINASGIQDDGSGNGELVSTIFNVGTEKVGLLGGKSSGSKSDSQVRGGSTIAELQNASWSSPAAGGCLIDSVKHNYVQYKLINISSTQYETGASFVSSVPIIELDVKDASTGQMISNADVTVTNVPYLLTDEGDGHYQIAVEYEDGVSSYNLSISATGYQSTTTSISINDYVPGECFFVTYNKTVNLSTTGSSSPNPPSSPSSPSSGDSVDVDTGDSVPANFDSTVVPLAEFQQTKLPAEFTVSGSKTTDLSKIADHKKVSGFTLDIPGKNKIVFKETLDLSARSTVDTLKQLNKYVKMASVGTIEVDSKAMPALNKKATITMTGLSFISTPQVLIDGKVDSQRVVSNVNYDPMTGKLTFDITHFSTLEAVPKIELLKPSIKTVTDPNVSFLFRISDPNAKVAGSFNGVRLADMTPDPKTGEFTVNKLAFEEGDNILKLNAESKLGKMPTYALGIKYDPKGQTTETDDQSFFLTTPFLTVSAGAFVIALILFLLLYRRRKRHERLKAKSTGEEKPKAAPRNFLEEEKEKKQESTQQKQ